MDNPEQDQPTPKLSPEDRLKIFRAIHENLKVQHDTRLQMDSSGRVESTQTAEMIDQLEEVDYSDAQEGDVVWWTTRNTNNYFMASSFDKTINQLNDSYVGFGKDGEEKRKHDQARLIGSSLGGTMIVNGRLKKGMTAEVFVPSPDPEEPGRRYVSTPSQEIGIIRKTPLPIATPTP